MRSSRILFVQKEGLFAEPSSASLGRLVSAWLQKNPRASTQSKRAIKSFPVFFVRPSRILFVRKEGLFAEPLSASLGRWVSAWLQEEPPSLRTERDGDQGFL